MIILISNKNSSITVKQILETSWISYISCHDVKDYQLKDVEKALSCYGTKNGCYVYYCSHCDKFIFQSKGCNSRICSCCGKRYTDQWAENLSNGMLPVPHRHIVLSVPDKLWPFLMDWENKKAYMNSAIEAFNDYFLHLFRRKIKVGVIVVLHSFGKDMKFQPHLHLLVTQGGFDGKNRFVPCSYIPANGFRKTWQHHVLKLLKSVGLANQLVNQMYTDYKNGFYVWLAEQGKIKNKKEIGKYVGRYVRHPAVANSRIDYFDGKIVKFHYINNDDQITNVIMPVFDFISALIQHIPPKQFKMIRYYGAYARNKKRIYGSSVHSSIRQLNLFDFGVEKVKYCPYCKNELSFQWYCGKGPPDIAKIQKELLTW